MKGKCALLAVALLAFLSLLAACVPGALGQNLRFVQATDTHIIIGGSAAACANDGRTDNCANPGPTQANLSKFPEYYARYCNTNEFDSAGGSIAPTIAWINATSAINNVPNVNFTVITGDLVAQGGFDSNKTAAIDKFKEIADTLGIVNQDYYVTLANMWHDNAKLADNRNYFESKFGNSEYYFVRDDNLFISVIDKSQYNLSFINDTLNDHKNQGMNLFIFMHGENPKNAEFTSFLKSYGNNYRTKVIMKGHSHVPKYEYENDIHYVTTTAIMNYPTEFRIVDIYDDYIRAYMSNITSPEINEVSETMVEYYIANDIVHRGDTKEDFWGEDYERNIYIDLACIDGTTCETDGFCLDGDCRHIPMDGLVSWWRMDDTNQTGEGALVEDYMNRNNGTAYGNASQTGFDSGYMGLAFEFDGDGDYIDCGKPMILTNSPLTYSAWVKTSQPAGTVIERGAGSRGAQLVVNGTYGEFSYRYDSSTVTTITGISSINDNEWHFLVGTINGSGNMSLYVDGALEAEGTSSLMPGDPVRGLTIGGIGSGAVYVDAALNGTIDEVMIYNRSLSANEIQDIYNSQRPHPYITAATDASDPAEEGETINFGLNFTSPDGKDITAYVCRTDVIIPGSGCDTGQQICSATNTTHDQATCPYTAQASDIGTSYYYAFVCDSDDMCSPKATRELTVTPPDTTPPVRSNPIPYNFSTGLTSPVTLGITTNEPASCSFSTLPDQPFESMTPFNNSDCIDHSTNITLASNQTYDYYIKCQDQSLANNTNPDDYLIRFSVGTGSDATAPEGEPNITNNETSFPSTQPTIQINWSLSSDPDSGISHYEILLDGTSIANVTQPPQSIPNPGPGYHTVLITAYNFDGIPKTSGSTWIFNVAGAFTARTGGAPGFEMGILSIVAAVMVAAIFATAFRGKKRGLIDRLFNKQ